MEENTIEPIAVPAEVVDVVAALEAARKEACSALQAVYDKLPLVASDMRFSRLRSDLNVAIQTIKDGE